MKILIISFSNLLTDPRVIRQIRFLSETYEITAAGFKGCAVESVEFIPVDVRPRTLWGKLTAAMLLKTRRYESYYWSLSYVQSAWEHLRGKRFDAIVANDINALPLALRLAGNRKVLFDAHEYSPCEFEDRRIWRFFFQEYSEYLCRTYLPGVAGMITVSEGIADKYRRTYGIDVDVVTNNSLYCELDPTPVREHEIRMVHHGAGHPSRGLEAYIKLMDLLDERFYLDLLLVPGTISYISHLRALAKNNPRIRFVDPVPMSEIPKWTNRYDVGICYFSPLNVSLYFSLPNKFFEFIQARLAVATGPSPEMAAIVKQYDCGIVAGSFDIQSLADKLNALTTDRITHYKRQADIAARELCFENISGRLLQKVRDVIGAQ